MKELEQLPIPLLQWFQDNARTLPWRSDPTPYHVWVSEIMLQQTRVAAVLEYYRRFMEALPEVADLALVEEDRLMKLWQGLGYYNRARNLQKAARQVMEEFHGAFPNTYEEILSLAGVGEYTAGAIASIAFGVPVPAVDGNVLRVVARLTGDEGDVTRPETRRRMRQALLDTMPRNLPGDYNQALMELGAIVCLPNGAPLCGQCPAAPLCAARREDRIAQLPVKAAKKARRIEKRTVYLLFYGGKVALRRRPGRGLLAGLWEFPSQPQGEKDVLDRWGIVPLPEQVWAGSSCAFAAQSRVGRHVFTHIEWHMDLKTVFAAAGVLPAGWVWADAAALEREYAVPNAFRFAADLALSGMEESAQWN
ncbi:A/G-specific adenine glycosylase [Pseudoflavonifractor sp. 524-17]|uniref:A/G-specific adenine glycosylase n=1 Tax=Pseudoflavonifractor sp. 524-17 TaxID=2304577 RepID=UPI00137AA691|nr:A/G-specific adenine glycosylase [Pseudoflavonifractor sp. 524-17]